MAHRSYGGLAMQGITLEANETREGILAARAAEGTLDDTGLHENSTKILDSLVPLRGASHGDVVEYRVEIPLRYAECYAVLPDGRQVKFADPRKFKQVIHLGKIRIHELDWLLTF